MAVKRKTEQAQAVRVRPARGRKRPTAAERRADRAGILEHMREVALRSAALMVALVSLEDERPFGVCVNEVADMAHALLHVLEDELAERSARAPSFPARKPRKGGKP